MNHTSDVTQQEGLSSTDVSNLPDSNVLIASGELDEGRPYTELHLSSGQTLRIPTALLKTASDARSRTTEAALRSPASIPDDAVVIPVIEEQLEVGKRTVVTGKVLLDRRVQEYHETLDVPLAVSTFDIERVVLNRHVDAAPPVRQEGDTTIYSLVEEQLVLTTQLVLKEELRVTRRQTERRDTRTVTLKRDLIEMTRTPGEALTDQPVESRATSQKRG